MNILSLCLHKWQILLHDEVSPRTIPPKNLKQESNDEFSDNLWEEKVDKERNDGGKGGEIVFLEVGFI